MTTKVRIYGRRHPKAPQEILKCGELKYNPTESTKKLEFQCSVFSYRKLCDVSGDL